MWALEPTENRWARRARERRWLVLLVQPRRAPPGRGYNSRLGPLKRGPRPHGPGRHGPVDRIPRRDVASPAEPRHEAMGPNAPWSYGPYPGAADSATSFGNLHLLSFRTGLWRDAVEWSRS